MSTKTVISQLDQLLKPLAFSRQNATWNRRAESVVDVIDVQVSKAGDTFTINAGVLDKEVHRKLWGGDPPELVEQPICTVGVRIGELLDGRDKWWPMGDDEAVIDARRSVEGRVLPFLDRMRARRNMEQWLIDAGVTRKRYPMPIITLAIIKSLLGDLTQGCDLLTELQKKSVGAWRARAAEVAERLRCS